MIVYLLLATAALNQVSTPACSCVRAFSSHSGISLHSLGSHALTPFPPSLLPQAGTASPPPPPLTSLATSLPLLASTQR